MVSRVVSVDTKKKELVGTFENRGQRYRVQLLSVSQSDQPLPAAVCQMCCRSRPGTLAKQAIALLKGATSATGSLSSVPPSEIQPDQRLSGAVCQMCCRSPPAPLAKQAIALVEGAR